MCELIIVDIAIVNSDGRVIESVSFPSKTIICYFAFISSARQSMRIVASPSRTRQYSGPSLSRILSTKEAQLANMKAMIQRMVASNVNIDRAESQVVF